MRIVALTALLFFSTYACFVFVHHRIRAYDSSLTGRADMLDVLRGLCANGVFCAHMVKAHALFQLGTSKALDHSLFLADYLGDLGVGVFFLITGYLFMGPAFPRSTLLSGMRAFMTRRMLRLGPAFCMLAALTFVGHVIYLGADGVANGPSDYLKAFVRLFSFGFLYPPIQDNRFLELSNGMTWSLSFEWIFYALVALAALTGRKLVLPAVCLMVGLAGWLALGNVTFFAYMAYFCFGGALFWALRGPRRGIRLALVAAASVAFGMATGRDAQLPPGLALVATCVLIGRVPASLRPFAEAGKVTYSYYLVHGCVLLATYLVCRPWLKLGALHEPGLFAFGLLAAAACACAASYCFRFFELPYFLRKSHTPVHSSPAGQTT